MTIFIFFYNMPQLVPFYFIGQVLVPDMSDIINSWYVIALTFILLATIAPAVVRAIPAFLQGLVHTNDIDRYNMDLYYKPHGSALLVYDRLEPRGSRLGTLVYGTNYRTVIIDHTFYVVLPIAGTRFSSTGLARLSTDTTMAIIVERNTSILSNLGRAVRYNTSRGRTYLVHKEN